MNWQQLLTPPGTPGGMGGPPMPNSFHKAVDPFGLFGGGGPASAHNVIPNSPHNGQKMANQGFATPFFANQQPAPQPMPQQAMGGSPMAHPGLPMTMFGNPQQSGPDPAAMAQLAQGMQQRMPMSLPPQQGNAQMAPQQQPALGQLGNAMMQMQGRGPMPMVR